MFKSCVYNRFSLSLYMYYITAQPVYITVKSSYYCAPVQHSNIFYMTFNLNSFYWIYYKFSYTYPIFVLSILY